MKLIILIVLMFFNLLHFFNCNELSKADLEKRKKAIEELEKTKGDLFKKVNEAIEESIQSLKKNNNSEALLGISYIEDLAKQIKLLNETESRRSVPATDDDEDDENYRRAELISLAGDAKLFDIDKVFGDKKRDPKKWQQRYENRIIIQKKLDEWIAQRELEKAKIKKYKQKQQGGRAPETCPREGKGKGKKKNGKSGKSGMYPCCRKCCKRSYMGCLKK